MKRILIALVLGTISVPTYGGNVTLVVEGVFAEYDDPDGLLPFAEPAADTIFTIKLTYDDTTPDTLFFVPYLALYDAPFSEMSLTIGSEVFGIGTGSSILVGDDLEVSNGDFEDVWDASTHTKTLTGTPNIVRAEGFKFIIWKVLASMPVPPLSSDNLVVPSWPSDWGAGKIGYTIWLESADGSAPSETLASASANVTSITVVPLPAAVWLFGSALGLFGWMRRNLT